MTMSLPKKLFTQTSGGVWALFYPLFHFSLKLQIGMFTELLFVPFRRETQRRKNNRRYWREKWGVSHFYAKSCPETSVKKPII